MSNTGSEVGVNDVGVNDVGSNADRQQHRTRIRSALARVPLWIGLGAILNLVLVELGPGRRGMLSLRQFDPWFVVLGAAFAFVPWITHVARIRIWSRALGHELSVRSALRVVTSSQVFAAVTPTSVGGAPAKGALLYREGLPAGAALSLTVLGTLEDAWFFAWSIPVAILLSPRLTFSDLSPLVGDAAHGVMQRIVHVTTSPSGVLVLAAVGLILCALLPWVRRRFGGRFRIWWRSAKEQSLEAGRLFWKQRGLLLLTLPLTTVQWCARYAIIYMLALGLGLEVDVWLLFVLQCLVFGLMVLVPTPGAAGGAEGVFLFFHEGIAGNEVSLLLVGWRALTFLLPVTAGAVVLLALERATRER